MGLASGQSQWEGVMLRSSMPWTLFVLLKRAETVGKDMNEPGNTRHRHVSSEGVERRQ